MDYEKEYKKRLDDARYWHDVSEGDIPLVLEEIFSELRESEDERISKAILTGLIDCRDAPDLGWSDFGGINIDECIAWLEKQNETKEINEASYRTGIKRVLDNPESYGLKKQGEQKPVVITPKFRVGDEVETGNEESLTITRIDEEGYWSNDLFICGFDNSDEWELVEQKPGDKVEPKFQNGQWIVWQNKCYKVNYNGCGYELIDQNGLRTSLEYGTVDENVHLWTIEDAKPGDVLVHNGITFIFKGIEDGIVKGLCSELSDSILNFGEPEHDKDYYPATKEQRDNLFAKMHEAGYMWDSKSKQLLSLKAEPSDIQTPTGWSEEDESMYTRTLGILGKCYMGQLPTKVEEELKWFKSLKQRIGG